MREVHSTGSERRKNVIAARRAHGSDMPRSLRGAHLAPAALLEKKDGKYAKTRAASRGEGKHA